MERVPVVAQSVEECLVLLGYLLLNEVGSTLRDSGDGTLDSSFVTKSAKTADK
jgi:hypothetical protein